MYDLIDFFVAALTHPIFFGFLSLMCFLLLRSILQGGQRLSVLYDAIDRHIETMASQNEQKAWDGLSFDLKNILLDKRRERKGPEYVGIARLKDFMTRLASLYQRESLIVDSLHEVRKVQRPRRMFMVRLRSSRTVAPHPLRCCTERVRPLECEGRPPYAWFECTCGSRA